MESPLLRFTDPLALTDLFDVYADQTPWESLIHTSNQPRREPASFGSLSNALVPKDAWHRTGAGNHGIYAIGFSIPKPAIYIGLAVGETFLSRLRKHRAKATGSYVGAGVSRTRHWRAFATARYDQYLKRGTPDDLADAVLMLGQCAGLPDESLKEGCKWFEARLIQDGAPRHALIEALLGPCEPTRLNANWGSRSRSVIPDARMRIGEQSPICMQS